MRNIGSRLMIAGLASALCGGAAAAPDHNKVLKGDYAFSGEATCLVSPAGFNPDLTPVGAPAPFPFVVSFSIQGVRRFNGDGTGSIRARAVGMRHPRSLASTPAFFDRGNVNATDLEGTFTYAVGSDLSVSVTSSPINGTDVAPAPAAGAPGPNTSVITNIPLFVGAVTRDGKQLTLAHVLPGVETHSFSRWNGSEFVQSSDQRVCHRTRILLEWKGH
jgi:hypothetical protein